METPPSWNGRFRCLSLGYLSSRLVSSPAEIASTTSAAIYPAGPEFGREWRRKTVLRSSVHPAWLLDVFSSLHAYAVEMSYAPLYRLCLFTTSYLLSTLLRSSPSHSVASSSPSCTYLN
uniref:BRCT domain-containing protein n=1 Tax=Mycena chlorophos TaxID=658473 RepID=A0ABQ0M9R6_MYCCL|nr:predicted protein [Mycena chlorophos]